MLQSEAQIGSRRLDESATGSIRLLWAEEFGPGTPVEYVAPPDGHVDLVVADRSGTVTTIVVGSAFPSLPKPTKSMTNVVVARLHAGAVPALFGVPARDLAGRAVPLSDILRGGVAVADRLANAPWDQRAALVESAFARAVPRRSPALGALERLRFDAGITVEQIATRLGSSTRTLRRLFDEDVGVSPRTFLALLRLNRAVLRIRRNEGSAAAIAASSGYFDQSHMIRDFKRFMGATPHALGERWRDAEPLFRPGVLTR